MKLNFLRQRPPPLPSPLFWPPYSEKVGCGSQFYWDLWWNQYQLHQWIFNFVILNKTSCTRTCSWRKTWLRSTDNFKGTIIIPMRILKIPCFLYKFSDTMYSKMNIVQRSIYVSVKCLVKVKKLLYIIKKSKFVKFFLMHHSKNIVTMQGYALQFALYEWHAHVYCISLHH